MVSTLPTPSHLGGIGTRLNMDLGTGRSMVTCMRKLKREESFRTKKPKWFASNGTPTQPPSRRYTVNYRDHHSRRRVRHLRLSLRRYEAARWLRKMVGLVAAKDLPAELSEEEFRLGLRSGLMLCKVLNKAQPGAVPKVVESPTDSTLLPDEAALSAYQYFENVRNFLVALEEMGLPTFEASDLEQGGISARVVNPVLALKSYQEWKQTGGTGAWKFGGNAKPTVTVKQFVRKVSEPFIKSLSRNSSITVKSLNVPNSRSLSMLINALQSDRKPEEVPQLVESVRSKVVKEFEHCIGTFNQGNLA